MTGGSLSSDDLVLVTGGAGFIGSHLVEHLVARGDQVVVIDDLSTGRRDNLAGVDAARLRFIEGSVAEGVERLDPAEVDEIYHLAAAVGVRLVIAEPIGTIETNVLQTSAVLDFAAAAGTPILVASTSEVYGKSSAMPFAEDGDVVYGPPTEPRWAYACSKAIDEFLALAHHRTNAVPAVVVRFFNIVGPRQVGDYGMVLPRFVESALAGRPIEVYGDGAQTRCFCDVRDVVGVLPKMLADPRCAGGVFNVGSDVPIEISELAELVKRTLKSRSPIVRVPYEQAFGSGFDDLRHRRPDLTRLRRVTGFAPRVPLEQTILDLAGAMRSAGSCLEPAP
jgi:UDP-glucose 4-epimerase